MKANITEANIEKFLDIHGIQAKELFGDEMTKSRKKIVMNEVFKAFAKCYTMGKEQTFKTKYRIGPTWKSHEFTQIPEYESILSMGELTIELKKYQIAREKIITEDREQYMIKREKLEKTREAKEQDQEIQR